MKKLHIVFLLILSGSLPFQSRAQHSGSGISGKLHDAKTKEPLGFASVALYKLPDSVFVKGMASDITGVFLLKEIKEGTYYLKISQVGYATKVITGLAVNASKPVIDLGTIPVDADAEKLDEVQVTADRGLVEHALDKQVINVSKDLNAVGGTTSDALRNAPSVAVDVDGNVSVRGSSNVTVLVDGKNTGQDAQTILGQMPASAIEKIEVITNPGSKYDAEGMGGIINIILKKEQRGGLNGNVAVNAGTYDSHNFSLNLNYRITKLDFFGGYDANLNYRTGYYNLDRSTTFEGSTTFLDQRQTGKRFSQVHIPKLGFDYDLTDKQSISFSVKQFSNSNTERETVRNGVSNTARLTDTYFTRNGENDFNIKVTDYTFSYRKTFEAKGRELTGSAVLTTIKGQFDRRFEQFNTNSSHSYVEGGDIKVNYLQDFEVKPFFAQLDYVHPIGEKGKFETGAKRSQRVLSTEFVGEEFDALIGAFKVDPTVSNRFGYDEFVNAAYLNYANTWKKLSYQFGLRAEQTEILVNDKGSNKKYPSNYFNLFPSIFFSQEINENLKLQLNYSRRINRPNYEALNPFVNYSDPLNLWYGNPYLKPEYIDSYEGSYVKYWNSGNVTATGFFRQVHNVIQQVRKPVSADTASNTYVNLNDGTSYGLEFSGSQGLAKWWKISGNAAAFNYKVSGTPLGVEANSGRFSWLGRINSNFNFPKGISAQVSFNYRGAQALAQGTRAANYNTDASIRKDIFNKKGTLTLRVSDIFNTQDWRTNIEDENLTYDLITKRQTRIITVGFSYRFGEQEKRKRPDAGNSLDGLF